MRQLTWLAVRIAAAVALVVVPFGYAITDVHFDVLIGAGCGGAIGVGVGLRGGSRNSLWTGILIGSIVGTIASLIAGVVPGNPWVLLVVPVLALAVGLIDGLGRSAFSGYRDVGRETLIMSVLVALGLFPALLQDGFINALGPSIVTVLLTPLIALVAGLLSQRREGWGDTRPPWPLVLGAVGVVALIFALGTVGGEFRGTGIEEIVLQLLLTMVVLPAAGFLLGRGVTTWLQPRLRVYSQLADYLRVMWVPIGGFAVGYLTIIVLFAGFYGMLERFSPGAFAGAGTGITAWVFFAFFTALAQDYATVVPASGAARALVGTHLILSVGWALVLFAAVMSSIQPKLDRIARRHADEGED